MVSLALSGDRQKLDTTLPLNLTFMDATTVAGGADGIDLPVVIDNLALDTITLNIDTDGTTNIVAPGGGLNSVKVGSAITGNADLVGAVVTAIVDDNNATVDIAATGTTAATPTNFDATFDATTVVVRVRLILSGTTLRVQPSIATLNGSNVADVSSGSDGLGYSDGTATNLAAVTVNLDSYLTSVGVSRQNS